MSRRMSRTAQLARVGRFGAALLVGATVSANLTAQGEGRETFTAFAVSTGGPRSAAVAEQVRFTVERWTTEAQRRKLTEVLQERGPDALLEALRDQPEVGHLRSPDSLGYPLRYADQQALPDGGRRIVLATDRAVGFWETWRSSRTLEYPFTVVELHVGEDGSGEGKLSIATKIVPVADRILLENWAVTPVQLTNVRTER
jgi:hypothetical protein